MVAGHYVSLEYSDNLFIIEITFIILRLNPEEIEGPQIWKGAFVLLVLKMCLPHVWIQCDILLKP